MNYFKEIKKLQERVSKLESNEATCNEEPTKDVREKITLKEFFDRAGKLCIHCDTEEKAKKLLKEFSKMGKRWLSGNSYLDFTNWDINCSNSVYYSIGTYGDIGLVDDYVKVYEFEDVIFEEEKFTENEKVILRNLPKEYEWLARDEDNTLWIFKGKPCKRDDYYNNCVGGGCHNMSMYKHLFQSIKWTDKEPCEFRKYL